MSPKVMASFSAFGGDFPSIAFIVLHSLVAVTVMRVLLFVLHVCLLRECDSVRLTTMLVCGMDEVW